MQGLEPGGWVSAPRSRPLASERGPGSLQSCPREHGPGAAGSPAPGHSGWTPFLSGQACEQRPQPGQPAPAPGSLRALPSQPPCASGCTRGNAHTHTCTHRRGGRVPLLTPRGQHPNLSPPVLVSVILQDRVQTGLSWTHMCCHLTYSDWLVFVRFYCIFIVIKPRSSILPTPSVPSSAGLGFPPGRPGGVGVRSWLQPRFPRV